MTRVYKKRNYRTTEERLLSLTPGSLRFIENVIKNKIKSTEGTKLSVSKLILSMKLDKDKREGKSSSSYESILMNKRKGKAKKEE